ncbi:S-phase kinase-associated protein 1-like [Physella acuta]|uniref:S-phase kinase-associated protein 1-like n=1 Tax=Physella acuta TaxID=109671 RepID=UPI0027DC028F|nr:S-phase kinase-associated protein 1-like [Physella acuta]
MLEYLGLGQDENEPVPLPNVNAALLKKVIQWCTFHRDDPPPSEDDENKEKRTDDVRSWDTEFLKVDEGTLFELILTANYVDIKGLLESVTIKTMLEDLGMDEDEMFNTIQLLQCRSTTHANTIRI